MFKEKYNTPGDPKSELADYVRLGGFPATHLRKYSQEEIYTIVRDIYNSTAFSDIVKRNHVRKIDRLELCRRGYTVHIGKRNDGEIDFVALRRNEKIYVQVTQEISSKKAEKREYSRLLVIHDNYPKYVLRTDKFAGGNYEGIKTMHIADFLLSTKIS